jgi:hypothetical protein
MYLNSSGRLRIPTWGRYDRWRLHKGRFCNFGPKMEVLRTHMEFCQGNCFFCGGANIKIKQVTFVISQNSMWLRNVLSYSTWPYSCIRENCTTCTFKPIFFCLFPWLTLISHKISAVPILLLSRIITSICNVFQPMVVQSTYQQILSYFSYNEHSFINLPLSHTFSVILILHSCLNFSTIHALRP